MKKLIWLLGFLLVFAGTAMAAGTADDMTPAAETVCDALSGAPWGLCNAYCEAMDCDNDTPKASEEACSKTAHQFAEKTQGDALPCEIIPISDSDGDGITDDIDNCLDVVNPGQQDIDNNGIGDECDCLCYSSDDIYLSQNYNRRFSFDTGDIECAESLGVASLHSAHFYYESTMGFMVEHLFYAETSDGCTNDCADVCTQQVWVDPESTTISREIVSLTVAQALRCIQYITEVCQDINN